MTVSAREFNQGASAMLKMVQTKPVFITKRGTMQTIEKKDIYFSVVSMMEIEKGILLLARKDPNQANIIRNWFHNGLLPAFHSQILPISLELAIDCAD